MTRAKFEAFVRQQYETLSRSSEAAADAAAVRALGRTVFVWSNLTSEQLSALYGAIRAVALLTVEA